MRTNRPVLYLIAFLGGVAALAGTVYVVDWYRDRESASLVGVWPSIT